jgi:hypothetical protein
MNARSHGTARNRWADRLSRFDQSGLTVAKFWKNEHCSMASLYQWRSKLRRERSTAPTVVPAKIVDAADPSSSPQATASLDLPGGIRLRIEVPADLAIPDKQEATP